MHLVRWETVTLPKAEYSSGISCMENCSVFSANGDLSGNSGSAALLLFSVYQPGKGALHGSYPIDLPCAIDMSVQTLDKSFLLCNPPPH
ncbi:hypothetical protein GOBAR_DD29518 [Gossypium barbadense]|nr:hypothetical protein GOBAR_DD29518 [Gossypium barbadense]